ALAQPKPASGGAYIALFAMCASLGHRVCGRHQKVKVLIPRHIPGSFCEFSFSCLIRSAVGEGLYGPPVPGPTTGAPPEPTREYHKGTPLRTQSAIVAHFVKRLIPGHIPLPYAPPVCARAAKTSLGWCIHRAFCDVCEPMRPGLW